MLGVSKDTIRRDSGANAPPESKIDTDNEEVIEDSGANAPEEEDQLYIHLQFPGGSLEPRKPIFSISLNISKDR